MDGFFLILRRVTVMANWIGLTIMLPLMGLMVTVSVFMRYVVRRPIVGADEITGLVLLMVVYFSLAHCWTEGGHIRSEILISRLSPRLQTMANVWSLAVVLAFTTVLIYALSTQTISYFKFYKVTFDAEIPLWPFVALASLGSLLLGVAVLASLINILSQELTRRRKESES